MTHDIFLVRLLSAEKSHWLLLPLCNRYNTKVTGCQYSQKRDRKQCRNCSCYVSIQMAQWQFVFSRSSFVGQDNDRFSRYREIAARTWPKIDTFCAICCRPEVDCDVIHGRNVKNVVGCAWEMLKLLTPVVFEIFPMLKLAVALVALILFVVYYFVCSGLWRHLQ